VPTEVENVTFGFAQNPRQLPHELRTHRTVWFITRAFNENPGLGIVNIPTAADIAFKGGEDNSKFGWGCMCVCQRLPSPGLKPEQLCGIMPMNECWPAATSLLTPQIGCTQRPST
jgi:hypothetical protein